MCHRCHLPLGPICSPIDRRVGLIPAPPKGLLLMGRATTETPTRDRLLAAAIEVFAAKGYHGTSVDDIVTASDTSKGAFYHYFPSKKDIFLTLVDSLASLVEQGAEVAIEAEHGALAKVEAALTVVLETAAARRELAPVLLVEAVGLGPEMEQKRLEIHRRVGGVGDRSAERRPARPAAPPRADPHRGPR